MGGPPPTERALLVHLTVPAWLGRAGLDAAWDERMGALMRGLLESRVGRVGLVLAGRMAEDWSERHPDVVHGVRQGITDGRFEVVSTALYGPVLSAIPERDALDQLAAHTTLLKRVFGARATGGWLPHGIWDPTVPRLFSKAGLRWTTVDRAWLTASKAPAARVLSVERHGRAIAVLPSVSADDRWTGLAVIRVDAESDVPRALAAASRADGLPSSLVGTLRARAYLPAGGPAGLWERQLLADAGADALHKRMLAVSRMVGRLGRSVDDDTHGDDGPDPHLHQQARRYLFRAQAAEAYGPTPSVPHLRGAFRDRAWRDLLRAESLVEQALELSACDAESHDLDCDGAGEVRLRTRRWAVTLAPGREGAMTELCDRKCAINLLSGQVPVAFRDLWGGVEPVAMRWEMVTSEPTGDGSMRAVMVADSSLAGVPVRLTKAVHAPATGPLEVRLEVTNRGLEVARGTLSTELFPVLGGPRTDGEQLTSLSVEVAGGKVPLDEAIELPDVDAVSVIGWRARVEIEVVPAARLTVEPVEEGAARVLFTWPMDLFERDRERREIRVHIREVPRG